MNKMLTVQYSITPHKQETGVADFVCEQLITQNRIWLNLSIV